MEKDRKVDEGPQICIMFQDLTFYPFLLSISSIYIPISFLSLSQLLNK